MKHLLLTVAACIVALAASSQSLTMAQRFNMAWSSGDTAAQQDILNQWQQKSPNDAELIVTQFNYYFSQAQQSQMSMSVELPEGVEDAMVLTDSTGATAGYMYEITTYDTVLANKALSCIDRGITLYPERLDMRMGKITALGMLNRVEPYIAEVMELIDKTAQPSNQWVYPEQEPISQDQFSLVVMGYEGQLLTGINLDSLTTADSALVLHVRTIAESMVSHWPTDRYQLNMIAVTYNIFGQNRKALPYLERAIKHHPKDNVILANLSDMYQLLGEKRKARKCLKKIVRHGDIDSKTWAKARLAKL